MEFFLANGPGSVGGIPERPVFLDLKLHDIPNTVAGAVRAVLRLAPAMLTLLVVPGIRPVGAASGDQARTMAPREAMAAGADWMVVGRPITRAADPVAAAAAIAAEIG